jgi:signal peptidase I
MKWHRAKPRLRSCLLTGAVVLFAAAAWWYLAPIQVGGSTRYVVTSGTSMEPRFHAGDLALVRPAANYQVGEIVAYHSTLLHVTVLHRLIARHGNRYVFKGDNNSFIDPVYPTRSELLGKLWLRVPQGGRLVSWLHTPVVVAVLCAGLGLLLMWGVDEKRRRSGRRRTATGAAGRRGLAPVNIRDHGPALPTDLGALFIGSSVVAATCFVLGLLAFVHPAHRPNPVTTPYTQQVSFGYGARVPAGLVYSDGVLRTGDPIFLSLVHQLGVGVDYRLSTAARHDVSGTEQVLLRLTGPTEWTRTIPLTPSRRFPGDHFSTQVTLDLPQLQALITRVGALTGAAGNGGYTIAVEPRISLTGTVAGRPINTSFKPALTFQLGAAQLIPGSGSTSSGASQPNLAPSQSGSVATGATASSNLGVAGVALPVTALRWIAVIGFLLSAPVALLTFGLKRGQPFEETQRIQSKYGHLIVPIVATTEALSWAPYEVPDMKALVRLAESGDRLILHHRDEDGDTYLVNDESTVYRYQIRDNRVRWDEWSEPRASIGLRPDSAAGDHPATGQTLPDPDRSEQPEPGGEAHGIGDPGQVGTA